MHPGRKLGIGERIYFGGEATEDSHELAAEIIGRGTFGERHLRFDPVDDFFGVLQRIGHVPLPPYIDRPDTPADREQYQTVYAKPLGSVAAPTAGLHFTQEILDRIRQRGIETAEITLHVGLGTFQPVREEIVEEHKLHREWYRDTRRMPRTESKVHAMPGGAWWPWGPRPFARWNLPRDNLPTVASRRKVAKPTSSSIPDSSFGSSARC